MKEKIQELENQTKKEYRKKVEALESKLMACQEQLESEARYVNRIKTPFSVFSVEKAPKPELKKDLIHVDVSVLILSH